MYVVPLLSWYKDKDKEAFFNVAYHVDLTDNISSRAILRHSNILNRYLPALLYLPSTTPFMRASARELLVPFFYTFGIVRPWDSSPQPPTPKEDALPTELSRRYRISFDEVRLLKSKFY